MNVQPFFAPFPEIDLGDIVLREIQLTDAQEYLAYMNHPIMVDFLTKDNIPSNLEASKEEMEYWGGLFPAKKSIYWAIALKENNKMIGTAGFNMISFANSRTEISYDLSPEYWGRGIMLRAIKAILRFADQVLGIVRTQATVITTNQRSINVLERCGFKPEGCLEKYEIVNGEFKDYFMYARVL